MVFGREKNVEPSYSQLSEQAAVALNDVRSGTTPYSGDALDSAFGLHEAAERKGRSEGVATPLASFQLLQRVAEVGYQIASTAKDTVYAELFQSRRDSYGKVVQSLGSKAVAKEATKTEAKPMADRKQ